jgi:hypothetical protein
MQADFRPARRAWLVVIALAHLVALMALRPIAQHALEAKARVEGELVFLTLPPARRSHAPDQSPQPAQRTPRAAAVRPAPPPVASDAAIPDAPPAASAASPQTITLPASSSLPADPFAKAAPQAETLLEKARKSAASVDRQLRKESLNKFATIVQDQSPLARQMGRAYNGEVVLEQQSTMADGRTMKRFRAGGQEWCEYVNLVGAAGQDPFRDGNKVQVKTCP